MTKFLLAHDIGTTGNKATLYDQDGNLIAKTFFAYATYFPKVGWAEQNPEDWWKAVCVSTKKLIDQASIAPAQIASISFSAQMQGVVSVDENGQPLRHAMIWADMRAEQQANQLSETIGFAEIYNITGHRISSSYSGAKMVWLKEHQPDIYKQTYKHLHAKDYLIYKLTGRFGTDYSDASGMNLLDIRSKQWSSAILEAWEIDEAKLPELYPSSHVLGEVTSQAAKETGLTQGTPVVMGGGDGSCAALGAGIIEDGDIFNYIGSSSWIALSSNKPVLDPEMKTFNFIHLDETKYLPCGTMQAAGASYQWVRDQFYQDAKLAENQSIYDLMNEEAAGSIPGANKLLYLPYLLGERSPWWNPQAKGAFIGINIKHTRGDLARAALEGITMNLRVILEAFRNAGQTVEEMWLFGGGAKSALWRQILADVYGVQIKVPKLLDETTSMGAAIAGGVGVGLLKDFTVAKSWVDQQATHAPNKSNQAIYDNMFNIFKRSYEQLVPIYKELHD
ncbi:xylulokinase [Salirhabdus sp. Marseille-P4669]|uniref:xylulokinase n=1 Tax=Salirhabdus sp. Marseille-P4669 TaxID=2042310 RepID=UPI000C79E664|nr:xylulokinase [Salirhabdus sp. Marseille-P4669]